MVFGPEQATFLGRPGGEDQRAIRFCFLLEGTRDLEHAGNADRIVRGTVTEAIAGIGRTIITDPSAFEWCYNGGVVPA